jgi:Sugar-transfer associated ATP-grasp
VIHGLTAGARLPLLQRLRLLRKGFFSDSYLMFDLKTQSGADYVTDYRSHVTAPLINGEFSFFLRNKLAFHYLMQQFPEHAVNLVGVIENGQILDEFWSPISPEQLLARLRDKLRLVIKPVRGGRGNGVLMVESDKIGVRVGGEPCSLEELMGRVVRLGNGVIEEMVPQHRAIAALFPTTTNTVRVLTLKDVDTGVPFIATAILRIGNERSYPVDNWSRGGLNAPIDLATGELGIAVRFEPDRPTLQRYESHPESGARIAGVQLPFWFDVRDGLLQICRALPFLRYVGWDIIITETGFKILEGNNSTGVSAIQAHGPLLVDPAVRRFYEAHTYAKSIRTAGSAHPRRAAKSLSARRPTGKVQR